MKCLACSRNFNLYFCSATLKEVEEIIRPQLLDLIEYHKDDKHPNYLVSSIETLEKELEKQRIIKEDPYKSYTTEFGRLVKEVPDADCYFAIKDDLSELYIVPYDCIYVTKTIDGDSHMFGYIDKFEFSNLNELTTHNMAFDGHLYNSFDRSKETKEYILKDFENGLDYDGIYDGFVIFWFLYSFYQSRYLDFEEFESLIKEYQAKEPDDYSWVDEKVWNMDQVHLRTDLSLITDRDHPKNAKKRTYEKELKFIESLDPYNTQEVLVKKRVFDDYLDDIISLETFTKILPEEGKYLQKLAKNSRKRHIWQKRT